MLTVNPYKRITAAEALKHPWICVSIVEFFFAVETFAAETRIAAGLDEEKKIIDNHLLA